MALADFDAFRDAVANPTFSAIFHKAAQSATQVSETIWTSNWQDSGFTQAGTIPSTAAVPDNTTTGRIIHPASSGRLVVIGAETGEAAQSSVESPSMIGLLIDRLSHQGGLVGNVNTLQTTNLPTAALTRYSSGEGVMIGVEVYSGLGATDSVLTVTYTNSGGTGSRTATIPLTDTAAARCFYIASLQAGDTGVDSVESVQLSASTGTAGNFGITLFKPLCLIADASEFIDATKIVGWNSQINTDACLQVLLSRETPVDLAESATMILHLAEV